ncbi:6-phospho-beta-glucosidase [Virgibacillus dakarensis]|uniref:6-phospho-beta-glucosidase n=1 Tax=Virgibacillus dakarensis TaxID=1917889 RepID=UPI000B44BE7B|nr:6-phospho-beta-glucosidase [Virgibacillus dakarensis]
MALKVVVIGGGSSYTPEIVEGMIRRHNSFPVTDIVLVDIEAGKEKLEVVGQLAARMIEEAGKAIRLSWTLDRKKALENADFVSTQIRVGGLKARALDERIPLSHGYIGQETNGAGGAFKAFRTIPVLMDIAKDIQAICPDAWMINFTNPAGMVTEALQKHAVHKKVIGVCNIPYNMRHSVAEILDIDPATVRIEFVGMNHFVFGKNIFVKGVNRTAEVLEKLASDNLDYSPANIVNIGWSKTFIEATKLLPSPYHEYYFHTKEVLQKDIKAFEEHGTRAEVVQLLEESLFDLYRNPDLRMKPKELEQRGGAYYSDVACSLMDSIYNDKGDIQTVNTRNNGAISDFADESVIEANCVITKDDPNPLAIGELPYQVKGAILQMKAFEELVIQAAITGNYEDAYLAFIMNPLIADERDSKVLLDELLAAHQAYLPQFQK